MVLLLQYIGLMFSTLTPEPAPVWFAAGTATAFIFMRGISILPGIWLGTFIAYFFVMGFNLACVFASMHVFQAFSLLWFNYHFISPTLIFIRTHTFIKFIISSGLITFITCYILFYYCQQQIHGITLPVSLCWQWWLADMNGIIIIACAIITWDIYFPDSHRLFQADKLQLGLMYGTLATITFALALSNHTIPIYSLALLMISLTLLISWMYGWCGSIAAMFTVALILSMNSYLNTPPRGNMLISIQLFLLTATISGLFVGIQRYEHSK